MKLIKKILAVFLILGSISIMFFSWYPAKHKMDEAVTYEINDPAMELHLLIATQGSEFKDAVVEDVIMELKSYPLHIQVIDVKQLTYVKEEEWSAIVILHTWENFKPQKDAQRFIEQMRDRKKLIVLSTSGSGTERIEGIDGITSASMPEEITSKAEAIISRVKTVLKIKEP